MSAKSTDGVRAANAFSRTPLINHDRRERSINPTPPPPPANERLFAYSRRIFGHYNIELVKLESFPGNYAGRL